MKTNYIIFVFRNKEGPMFLDTTLSEKVFYWLAFTNKKIRYYTQQYINKLGYEVTFDQWELLKTIADHDHVLNQRKLAVLVSKDNASVTRIINSLIEKELLTRKSNKNDRRSFDLRLTDKGTILVMELTPQINQFRNKGLKNLTEGEVKILSSLLKKIHQNVEE